MAVTSLHPPVTPASHALAPLSLEQHPIHLDTATGAHKQPEFPRDERAMQWYMDYAARTSADGAGGRLVAMYHFSEDWAGWEMHPAGDEVVLCTAGKMVLTQQLADGSTQSVTLLPGEFAINPAGVWHTADIPEPATGVFITAGHGTQHRPR